MKEHAQCVVSVIMPVFNSGRFVKAAVDSVISQTFTDWELIIVDDCSTDETPQIIADLASVDERIRVFRLPANTGSPAGPRNKGIEEAKARYIAFLDSDDRWLPTKLEEQIREMKGKKAALSCTAYDVINGSGARIGGFNVPSETTFTQLLTHNTLGCLTVMYDSAELGKRYFPYCGHEDYALWLDIAREGIRVVGINNRLAEYRQRGGSVSSNKLKTLSCFLAYIQAPHVLQSYS